VPDLHKLDRPEILRFIFYPRPTARTPPPPGAQDIDFSVADDVRIGCRLHRAEKDQPVILYFHGNGETVADYDDIGPFYAGQNLNLLICDYRGYGWSGGTPSVGGMISDGRAIYREAREWLAQNGWAGSFLVMGRSLGSASAIDLAAEHNAEIDGLIIESGFAETVPLAANLGVDLTAMGLTEEDGFNNIRKIESVTKPILILHGQRDTLIPLGQAQKLHAAAGAKYKELQIVPGADHNSVIMTGGRLYFETIRRFADKAAGAEQPRRRGNR
jgi:alpha-beta hydrolase superfamily lysophospholipase